MLSTELQRWFRELCNHTLMQFSLTCIIYAALDLLYAAVSQQCYMTQRVVTPLHGANGESKTFIVPFLLYS